MDTVREINRYIEHAAPWRLAKEGQTERTATVLYHAAEALRLTSVLLHPVLPERMTEVWHRLGWQPSNSLEEELVWGRLQPGSAVTPGPPLFPKDLPGL